MGRELGTWRSKATCNKLWLTSPVQNIILHPREVSKSHRDWETTSPCWKFCNAYISQALLLLLCTFKTLLLKTTLFQYQHVHCLLTNISSPRHQNGRTAWIPMEQHPILLHDSQELKLNRKIWFPMHAQPKKRTVDWYQKSSGFYVRIQWRPNLYIQLSVTLPTTTGDNLQNLVVSWHLPLKIK